VALLVEEAERRQRLICIPLAVTHRHGKLKGQIEVEQETDGRWIAEVAALPGDGWPDYVFSFHDDEEIGPRMLARIARHTGLLPERKRSQRH
jgi:hypothetical protein